MALFAYTARNSQGKIIHGTQEAATENDAINILQGRNLLVTRVELSSTAFQKASGGGTAVRRHNKIKAEDLLFFISQISTLLEAGVPMLRALEIVTDQTASAGLYRVLGALREDIKAGSTLKDAVARHPKVFPVLWGYMIDAGESSGSLPLSLNQLANQMEFTLSLKSKVVSALVYPAVLFTVAIGAIIVFMLKIIPVFAKLFGSFNAELPALTKMMLNASLFTQHYIVYLASAVALLAAFLRRYFSSHEGRVMMDHVSLRLPVFGGFVRDSIIARITINLSSLIKSGVSIIKSLEITAHVSGNSLYESALMDISAQVQQGKPLAACFRQNPLFPTMAVQLMTVGEESGKLPEMIARVAKYYTEQVDTFVSRLSVLIEPIILIVVGGIVGVIVIAMFLPIFSISSVVG